MYNIDNIDESVLEACKKQFNRIYPEFHSRPIGVSQDKQFVIMQCEFPDGTYYFRVDEHSVSTSFNTKEDADKQ